MVLSIPNLISSDLFKSLVSDLTVWNLYQSPKWPLTNLDIQQSFISLTPSCASWSHCYKCSHIGVRNSYQHVNTLPANTGETNPRIREYKRFHWWWIGFNIWKSEISCIDISLGFIIGAPNFVNLAVTFTFGKKDHQRSVISIISRQHLISMVTT